MGNYFVIKPTFFKKTCAYMHRFFSSACNWKSLLVFFPDASRLVGARRAPPTIIMQQEILILTGGFLGGLSQLGFLCNEFPKLSSRKR